MFWFVVGLLRRDSVRRLVAAFYLQTSKVVLINRKYQIIVISMLKNRNNKHSSNYIIKFVSFMPVYYAINLNIILSCIVFSYLYLGSIDLFASLNQ